MKISRRIVIDPTTSLTSFCKSDQCHFQSERPIFSYWKITKHYTHNEENRQLVCHSNLNAWKFCQKPLRALAIRWLVTRRLPALAAIPFKSRDRSWPSSDIFCLAKQVFPKLTRCSEKRWLPPCAREWDVIVIKNPENSAETSRSSFNLLPRTDSLNPSEEWNVTWNWAW